MGDKNMNNKRKQQMVAIAITSAITAQSVQPIFAIENEKINIEDLQQLEFSIESNNIEEIEAITDENIVEENIEIINEENTDIVEVHTEEVEIETVKEEKNTVDLRILATTDLHANLMDHDYYTDKGDQNFGLSKAATVIKEAKAEADKNKNKEDEIDNAILVDNGDTIQGNPLATVYAVKNKVKPGQNYPVYEALDKL